MMCSREMVYLPNASGGKYAELHVKFIDGNRNEITAESFIFDDGTDYAMAYQLMDSFMVCCMYIACMLCTVITMLSEFFFLSTDWKILHSPMCDSR